MQIIRNTIKYKDSGIEWIGKIPKDWNLIKGKYLYSIDTGKLDADAEDLDGKYPFFTCSMHPKKINKYSFDCEALLVAGNGLVGFTQYYEGKFDAYQRTYVLSKFNNINPMFLKYYVSNNLSIEVNPNSLGSVIQFIKLGDLQNFNICIPPLDEQQKIVDFLDKKCGEIDNAIETEKNVIEKLKEYKQSVITETVTKGLDKSVELKNSGIKWIGKIPKHWQRTKLKRILEIPITDGPHETPILFDEGIPFISAEAIKDNKINFKLMRGYISLEEHLRFCKKYKPKKNDIFMIKSGATTGNVAIVDTDKEFSIWSPLAVMRANKNRIYYKYLFYYIQSYNFKQQVEQFWSYGTQQNIGMEVLGNLYVAYSCNIQEQQQIADYLDKKCSQIDETIKKKEELIEKLTEYKKSLIYECVTGKRKVSK